MNKVKSILQPHLKPIARYGIGMISKSGGLGTAALAQVIFARLMGPSKYGLMALTLSTVLLPANLATLGVNVSLSRFMAVNLGEKRPGLSRKIAFNSGVFMGIMSLCLMLIFVMLHHKIGALMKIPELTSPLLTFTYFIPAVFLHSWTLSVLRGLGLNATQITLESPVLQILTLGCGYGLWTVYGTVQAVIVGYGIAYAAVSAVGSYLASKSLLALPASAPSDSVKFKELIIHGIPINITTLAEQLLRRGDVFVIGVLLGDAAVGIYRCAYEVASGVKQLMSPINNFALFRMSKNFGRNKVSAVFDYYHFSILLTLALALPMYLAIFVFAERIIDVLFGPKYAEAIPLLKILTIGFIIYLGVGPFGSLFNALGRNWSRMWIVLCVGVNNIFLNFILIKWFGLLGSAISTSISFTILYVTFLFYLKKNFLRGFSGPTALLMMVFTIILALLLDMSFPSGLIQRALITGCSAISIFLFGAFISYRFRISRQGIPVIK